MLKDNYQKIFIVDALSAWGEYENVYDVTADLVLTYDLGLFKFIQSKGGAVNYIDHLIDSERMHVNNYKVFEFFKKWHLASDGEDIFKYKDVSFGFSFRIDIWNDLVYYSKLHLCLSLLKEVSYKKMLLSSSDKVLISVLDDLSFNYNYSEYHSSPKENYFFPIAKYMDDRIRPKGIRAVLYKIREVVTAIFGFTASYFDSLTARKNRKTVFIQEYHPTKALIASLREEGVVNVLLANFSRGEKIRKNISERVVPVYGSKSKFNAEVVELLELFSLKKKEKLVFDDGSEITDEIYRVIEERVENVIHEKLRILDCSIKYLDKNKVELEVLIANIGLLPTLFDCVCRTRNIPSYLIINGILGPEYSDDSKYASVINAYSASIKDNYFKGMSNIEMLGDPRMDMYPPSIEQKKINRNTPTIVIGASGFSPIDLNSYVAIEFDFMFDVLSAFKKIRDDGDEFSIIIKVRPNGYKQQYVEFVEEYFPGIVEKVIDNKPMLSVLKLADFYISINSQTLFEASCLGVPVLYYKKDCEKMVPPFNADSELVTVSNVGDLINAFYDYKNSHHRYDDFLQRKVMEKYIGPLDGNNLRRNLSYIHSLLEKGCV